MPHKCTNCGCVHEDGTDSLLDGCDGCGGTKFQFVSGTQQTKSEQKSKRDERDWGEWPDTGKENQTSKENKQSSKTNGKYPKLTSDDIRPGSQKVKEESKKEVEQNESKEETPFTPNTVTEIDEVKKELNRQFESIKVIEPGKYSLNLSALFNNDEYVIALEEDGQYRIEPLRGF